ncbi:hypothetical protein SERLA73DRAFT_162742 [Serpula lacrymans var. lacrymans S7.3]|uniref:F-box domain-containing protein n=1 Tax=Serpula lacrymans var. lacrymans (strain S7.3) TaxID=936435 RepID=F8Q9G6_SERL3|nr:hypothetical protein SERLA73DRAFT_162742 [Serpula lacrymans var. lacrymans S7.3]
MSGRGKGGKGLGKGGAKRHRKILRDNIQGCSIPDKRRRQDSVAALGAHSDPSLPNETLITIFHGLAPSVLTRLARYPHLASGVKRFQLRWTSQRETQHTHGMYLEMALLDISQAIGCMTTLEVLDLSLGLADYYSTSVLPHAQHTFPLLHQISLSGLGHYPQNALNPFLNAVPSIHHLRLTDSREQLLVLPCALPSLVSFCGCPRAAATVLPGRPVQSLALIGQDYVTDVDLSQMALTSVPLRYLDLSAMSVTPTLLRNVSRFLSTVESLKVKLALRHTLHYALSGIRLLAALSHPLGAFQRLSTLDLSPTHIDGDGLRSLDGNGAEESSICQSWHTACPSLRRVVFPSKTEWLYKQESGTWVPVLDQGSRRRPLWSPSTKKFAAP